MGDLLDSNRPILQNADTGATQEGVEWKSLSLTAVGNQACSGNAGDCAGFVIV